MADVTPKDVSAPTPIRKSWWNLSFTTFVLPLVSILLAMLIGALIMVLSGYNPVIAYRALWQGAFGNTIQTSETLKTTVPLLLAGLGIAFAFKGGAFNIGAVG